MNIDQNKIDGIELKKGAHASPEDGMCLLEAAAYLAGEGHSDQPQCVCPVLAAFGRGYNDRASNSDRQALKAVLPHLIGTRGSVALEQRRMFRLVDFAVRECAPVSLDKAGLTEQASGLRALAPIVDRETARAGAAAYYATSAAAYLAAYRAAAALPVGRVVEVLIELCAMQEAA